MDKENGGDVTAEKIQRRFRLLDFESKDIIDFYFLGWYHPEYYGEESDTIRFSLEAFEEFRTLLRNLGIRRFGGYADLILLDGHISRNSEPRLNFSQAVHIDLARQMAEGNFPTLKVACIRVKRLL